MVVAIRNSIHIHGSKAASSREGGGERTLNSIHLSFVLLDSPLPPPPLPPCEHHVSLVNEVIICTELHLR